MSAEADFRAVLLAASGVTALVGTRVALNAVPQDVALPYIVFSATHTPQQELGGPAEDQTTLNVECWAADALGAIALADAVEAAIEAYDDTAPGGLSVTVLERTNAYDPDLQLDGVTLTVEWWP